jgi:hypothetical protein
VSSDDTSTPGGTGGAGAWGPGGEVPVDADADPAGGVGTAEGCSVGPQAMARTTEELRRTVRRMAVI